MSGTFELRRLRHRVDPRPVATGRPPAVLARGRDEQPASPVASGRTEVERTEAIALR